MTEYSDLRVKAFRRAFEVFNRGGNVTLDFRRSGLDIDGSAIEIIYDLQSGSYTEWDVANPGAYDEFAESICAALNFVDPSVLEVIRSTGSTIVDVGCGEGNTLAALMKRIGPLDHVVAVDISSSRLNHAVSTLTDLCGSLNVARADSAHLPLPPDCFDVALSVHALEPNGSGAARIISELLRVSRRYVVLVEPDFETAHEAMRQRMLQLNYVSGIEAAVAACGARLISKVFLESTKVTNPDNLSTLYLIDAKKLRLPNHNETRWVDPFFGRTLIRDLDGWWKSSDGIWFPELRLIPQLSPSDARIVR